MPSGQKANVEKEKIVGNIAKSYMTHDKFGLTCALDHLSS